MCQQLRFSLACKAKHEAAVELFGCSKGRLLFEEGMNKSILISKKTKHSQPHRFNSLKPEIMPIHLIKTEFTQISPRTR